MQTRKDDSAFPYATEQDDGSYITEIGLTKREYFASAALPGLIRLSDDTEYNPAVVASAAIELADLLILMLNKSGTNKGGI